MAIKKPLVQGGFTPLPPGATAQELARTSGASEHRAKAERVRKALASCGTEALQASLRAPSPRHDGPNLAVHEDLPGSQLTLPVMEILPYHKNPRTKPNDKFLEIKESIRESGLEHSPNVTRMPGASQYMVYGGGNTRLACLQELWTETRDPRFETLTTFFRPWVNERKAFASSMVENEQREDMCFWDRVQGYMALKAMYETDVGPLSNRKFEEMLRSDGLPASKTVLHIYQFSYGRLSGLGNAAYALSKNIVRDLVQPRLNCALRLSQRFGLDGSRSGK